MFGHLRAFVLMHATDVLKGAWYEYLWAITVNDVYVRVDRVSAYLNLATHGTIDGKLGTYEHVMMSQLICNYIHIAMFTFFTTQWTFE
jgi:hypothetical protein